MPSASAIRITCCVSSKEYRLLVKMELRSPAVPVPVPRMPRTVKTIQGPLFIRGEWPNIGKGMESMRRVSVGIT